MPVWRAEQVELVVELGRRVRVSVRLGLCFLSTRVRTLASSPWMRVPALSPGARL